MQAVDTRTASAPSASTSAVLDKTQAAGELAEMALQLQRGFFVEISAQSTRGGISLAQHTLLGFLIQRKGGLNMSQMASLMRHTTPATTGLVDRLVEAGLVERFNHNRDRRQVLVRISTKGRQLVESMKDGMVGRLLEVFNQLDEADIHAWLRVYRALVRTAGQASKEEAAA